jgi:multidrug efflux pump subunit AcrA (membrane-fusion protein)
MNTLPKKNPMIRKLLPLLFLLTLVLAACSGTQTATPTPEAEIFTNFSPVISATGKVVPEQLATLSVQTPGLVAEMLVQAGDTIEADTVILRLEGQATAQAALAATQLELTAAQIALQDIHDADYALLAAQARAEAATAQKALDDRQNPELQQALAEQAITEAEKAVDDAERALSFSQSTASQADIDAAKAAVILAKEALDDARDDFEPYSNKPEDNLVRAQLQAKLSAAQEAYDATVRRLNGMLSTGDPLEIALAESRLATAQAQLIQAQRDWDEIKDGPDPEDVALLEAQIAHAEDEYTRLSNGPDPDDIALAEGRIANAEAQLAAAQAALDNLEVRAPFAGVVGELYIHAGEWIAPGQPVLLLADLQHLVVETTDLSEIDVARLAVGDAATLTFDALPSAMVNATVTRIAPKAAEGAGVNYTLTLELDEIPEGLRWGMTAFVDIEVTE